ncbi:MAG TPA: cupin domain-containing protein [Thermoleophilia bacterium]|nr:cupin domain-containing protein [Thermoleophilia bacterium]
MRPRARELAATLGLEPHPEGGFFRETYRADETVATPRGERPLSTAILFLVTAEAISHLHRLTSDELWVFQGGLPLELVTIAGDGAAHARVLGDVEEAERSRDRAVPPTGGGTPVGLPRGVEDWLPQALVPAGSWQGARLAGGPHLPADYAWALVSCIVTPGFSYEDFELGERETLLAEHPRNAELIRDFT